MDDELARRTRVRLIETACISILGILLAAGLWPFHVPKNDVTWLTNKEGLRFGRYGAIISASSFPSQPDKTSGSLEVWLEPSLTQGARTILSFDGSGHPGVPFSLRQLDDSLIVEQDNEDRNGNSWTAWSIVKGALRAEKPVFATIILKPRHTAIYLDGVFSKDTLIGDSSNNLTGRLVVANSPSSNDSWSGTIKGMAIYDRQLTQAEILEHYESWAKNGRPNLTQEEAPIALYLFDERAGDIAHSQFDHGVDLKIPNRYFVLHPPFLESPMHSYRPTWSYWKDVALNVVGFIPFGFFTATYFCSVRQVKGAVAIAVVLGFLTSLIIETLQAFLPTRDSGWNDIITNTVGTALGAMMYAYFGGAGWLKPRLERVACRSSLRQVGVSQQ
jgi:VanZ family protein